jgi:hypothetical protein
MEYRIRFHGKLSLPDGSFIRKLYLSATDLILSKCQSNHVCTYINRTSKMASPRRGTHYPKGLGRVETVPSYRMPACLTRHQRIELRSDIRFGSARSTISHSPAIWTFFA